MTKFDVDTFLDSLFACSDSPRRNGLIPKEIKLAIGTFRSDLYGLEEDDGNITLVIQDAGRLGLLGQYGYVDMLNEQYIKYNALSSETAMPVEKVKEYLFEWIRMLKTDFFDKEIKEKDVESAKTSIEDMESVEMWAKLTDQFDTEDILEKVQDCLEEMYVDFSKLKQSLTEGEN